MHQGSEQKKRMQISRSNVINSIQLQYNSDYYITCTINVPCYIYCIFRPMNCTMILCVICFQEFYDSIWTVFKWSNDSLDFKFSYHILIKPYFSLFLSCLCILVYLAIQFQHHLVLDRPIFSNKIEYWTWQHILTRNEFIHLPSDFEKLSLKLRMTAHRL